MSRKKYCHSSLAYDQFWTKEFVVIKKLVLVKFNSVQISTDDARSHFIANKYPTTLACMLWISRKTSLYCFDLQILRFSIGVDFISLIVQSNQFYFEAFQDVESQKRYFTSIFRIKFNFWCIIRVSLLFCIRTVSVAVLISIKFNELIKKYLNEIRKYHIEK